MSANPHGCPSEDNAHSRHSCPSCTRLLPPASLLQDRNRAAQTLPAQSSHMAQVARQFKHLKTQEVKKKKNSRISHHRRLQTKPHNRTTSDFTLSPPSFQFKFRKIQLLVYIGHSIPLQVSMLLYNLLELPLKVGRKSLFIGGGGYPSMHGRLREQLKGNDSPSSIWIPETELRSPDLLADTFNKL